MKYLFDSAKKTGVCLLIMVGSALTTFGNVYTGTITQTITHTNDSTFHLGQTFIGSYQYESDSIDGIFGVPNRSHDSAVDSLVGSLYNWNPHANGGVFEESLGALGSFLTVSNGCVIDFNFDGSRSFGQFWFSECIFTWSGYAPSEGGISTEGTISFSSPAARSVPEGTINTISMLMVGALFVGLTRQRLTAK